MSVLFYCWSLVTATTYVKMVFLYESALQMNKSHLLKILHPHLQPFKKFKTSWWLMFLIGWPLPSTLNTFLPVLQV